MENAQGANIPLYAQNDALGNVWNPTTSQTVNISFDIDILVLFRTRLPSVGLPGGLGQSLYKGHYVFFWAENLMPTKNNGASEETKLKNKA